MQTCKSFDKTLQKPTTKTQTRTVDFYQTNVTTIVPPFLLPPRPPPAAENSLLIKKILIFFLPPLFVGNMIKVRRMKWPRFHYRKQRKNFIYIYICILLCFSSQYFSTILRFFLYFSRNWFVRMSTRNLIAAQFRIVQVSLQ